MEQNPGHYENSHTDEDLHLKKALVQGQENERARLARELHDGIAPLLTTLKLKVSTTEMAEPDKEEIKELIDTTIAEIRRMSNNLMPAVLIDFGLAEAMRNLIRQLQANARCEIRYKSDLRQPTLLDPNLQLALYRIAQEGLHNALKHAQASEIRLSITEFDSHVSLYLSDDGQGFDQQHPQEGNGLRNMQARTQLFQGSFYLYSDHTGTVIEVEIPLFQSTLE